MNQQIDIEEYKQLRAEIALRISYLHGLIAIGNILSALFLIFGFYIYHLSSDYLFTYLLLIPIVFAGLTFNYQDNQRTLEATARYVQDKLKPKFENSLEWESFFAGQKKMYQHFSANKIFTLIIPLLIPIVLLISQNLNQIQIILTYIDLFLLIAVLINFRYKIHRVR